jgi:predicted AlkP superfamily pyrophosphatase or phosphodiesterase
MMQDSGERFNKLCEAAGYPEGWPLIELNTAADRMVQGFMADQYAANWVGILAAAPAAPDFIIAEYLITDPIQHGTGYKSMLSHWAIAQADAAVGTIIERLRQAGVEDRWNIAVMSDHGHSPIRLAIRTPNVLPGVTVQSEGAVLLIAPKNADELHRVTETLAEYGCEPFHTDYVPTDHRDELAAFLAPPGITFETDPVTDDAPTGRPINISSHGLRPGEPGDDRFAIFAGPDVTPRIVHEAAAIQVAPTFAKLLKMPVEDYAGESIL